MNASFDALLIAAATVGALHSAAPDHWTPLAAAARVRGWSGWRTSRVTLLCGFGHVSVSALMGLGALVMGLGALTALGQRMESASALLLLAFGVTWAAWGWHRAGADALHGHAGGHRHHHHGDHVLDHAHDASRATVASLFLLYCADPCVAVIPLLFAAAPLGAARATAVVVAYEGATMASMLTLTLFARAGASLIRGDWIERWGDVAAGGVVAGVGGLAAAGVF